MHKYVFNAKALLMLRCASCDETWSLFITEVKKSKNKSKKRRRGALNHVTLAPDNRRKLLSQLMKGLDEATAARFLQTWNTFSIGGAPKAFVCLLIDTYLCQLAIRGPAQQLESTTEKIKSGICMGDVLKYVKAAFSLLLDVERRFCAHLELLRQYPKMFTACCNFEHCFLCKIAGHHEGQTCEEVQSAEMGAECQYCPGCNVPTFRSEGCSEILCVCGKLWEWEGGDSSDDDSEGSDDDSEWGSDDDSEGSDDDSKWGSDDDSEGSDDFSEGSDGSASEDDDEEEDTDTDIDDSCFYNRSLADY